jgi:putative peptidoglycan lipid II flippase
MKLFKAFATLAGLTGLSRVAGFVRDILTASILGAGVVADAFFVALKLPNLFRRISAEGAFSVSFVPLYSESLEAEGEERATIFAQQAFSWMIMLLGSFTVLCISLMPFIIYLIAPGFREDMVRFDLAVEFSRITFPYLLLMSLTALLGGVLNTHGRFAPFAAAPILFNLCLIIALLFFAPIASTAGHALAWAVLIAGFVQFFMLYYFIKKIKFKIRIIKPALTPKIKKLFKLMGPGIVGAGVMHINLLVDLIIASMLTAGSISYLYYADRLNQLPMGIVGVAIGTALLPILSKAVASKNIEEARGLYNKALELSFLLCFPAAAGLYMIALPIIITLFEHGAFTRTDSLMTSLVLISYSAGIPAYVGTKVLSTVFWAKQNTTTPVKVSIFSTLFNVVFSLWFAFGLGWGVMGIALSTSVAGWIQFATLRFLLRGHEEAKQDKEFYKNVLKMISSCLLMALYLAWAKQALFDFYYAPDAAHLPQFLSLLALVCGGGAIYGLSIITLGVVKVSDIKSVLKRG